jgi:uncharacterized membrane protein YfcA
LLRFCPLGPFAVREAAFVAPAGSLLGARVSDRVATRALKILMAVVLFVVGARMALEGR